MAPTSEELLKQSADLQRQALQQQASEDALAKVKAAPRSAEVVLAALFEAIAMRLGNRPDLKLLIAEFKAATKQPDTETSPGSL